MTLIYTYRTAIGDFNLDFFELLSHKSDYVSAWIIFVIGALFLVIVLLNLLIALMGKTFEDVLENITNLLVMEKVLLVAENGVLFNRTTLFKKA